MNHYIFRITNTLTNQYFIGRHSCECEIDRDMFMGTEPSLVAAIERNGKVNFKKDIITVCESEEHAAMTEAELVTHIQVFDPRCYNSKPGGQLDKPKRRTFSAEVKQKLSEGRIGEKNPMFGRKHSAETKRKMAEAKRGKRRGPLSDEWRRNISNATTGKPKRKAPLE